MPFLWNNVYVVTQSELVPDWYSESALYKTIQRHKDKIYGIKRARRAAFTTEMLIEFDSLPKEIQHSIGDPRKGMHVLEQFYKIDHDAVNFFSAYKFENGSYLGEDFKTKYILNASVLKAVLKLREERKKFVKTGLKKMLCDDAVTFQEVLTKKFGTKHSLPKNERRFADALKQFEEIGYGAIISGKHGNENRLKVNEFTIELLNNMFGGQTSKPSLTKVYQNYQKFMEGALDVINNTTGEVYNRTEFSILSERTVRRYLTQWNNKIGTWNKRSGNRQVLMGQFTPYHSFKKVEYAGSVISIDDRQPPFKAHNGKRVWFYNGIDLGSECFTTWVYGETKEGIIKEFYRSMVRNYAEWGLSLPYELECEMSLNSQFTDTFLQEGQMFQSVKMIPNNARAKLIERYYGTLRYGLEKERKGWLARPTAVSEKNQSIMPIEKVPTLPFQEIINNCLEDIQEWNNMPHSVYKDKSRFQVFLENQHPKLKPTNYHAFIKQLGYRTLTSCRNGNIQFNNQLFLIGNDGMVSSGKHLLQSMDTIEGKELEVYWLDDNSGKLLKAFAYLNGKLICELISKPVYSRSKLETTPEDQLAMTIMSKYVATITAFAKDQKKQIDSVTIINNTPKRFNHFQMNNLSGYSPKSEPAERLDDIELEPKQYKPITKNLKDIF